VLAPEAATQFKTAQAELAPNATAQLFSLAESPRNNCLENKW
jgi:hypothetical protein